MEKASESFLLYREKPHGIYKFARTRGIDDEGDSSERLSTDFFPVSAWTMGEGDVGNSYSKSEIKYSRCIRMRFSRDQMHYGLGSGAYRE